MESEKGCHCHVSLKQLIGMGFSNMADVASVSFLGLLVVILFVCFWAGACMLKVHFSEDVHKGGLLYTWCVCIHHMV